MKIRTSKYLVGLEGGHISSGLGDPKVSFIVLGNFIVLENVFFPLQWFIVAQRIFRFNEFISKIFHSISLPFMFLLSMAITG